MYACNEYMYACSEIFFLKKYLDVCSVICKN